MRLNRRAAITAAAAAATLGGIGFFALGIGGGITLETLTPASDINVTDTPGVIPCIVEFDSTTLQDAGCSYVSPGGIERSCSPPFIESPPGTWSCNVNLEANIEGGTWTLSRVFARESASPESKYSATGAEIVAAGDVLGGTGGGGAIVQADIEVTVTSSNEDTTGPNITATTTIPANAYEIYGGTLTCENTIAAGGNGVLDTGCLFGDSICSAFEQSGGLWQCNIDVSAGLPLGANAVTAFARDSIGNRSRYVDNGTFNVVTGGLTFSPCNTVFTDSGTPLAIDLDASGNAWVIGEFSTNTIHQIVYNAPSACPASTPYTVPSTGGNIFWRNTASTKQTVLAEGVQVDPVGGHVYFSQGGGVYECNNTAEHTPPCTDENHSRIGQFTPGPDTFKMFNLPGNRNEAHGIYWDAAREWLWVAESGLFSDFVAGDSHQGAIIAFKPSIAFWDNALQTGSAWDAAMQPELCDGTGGNTTPDDGCYQRFQLPAAAWVTGNVTVDPSGFVWFTNFWGTSIGRLDPATEAVLLYPEPVTRTSQNAIVGSGTWAIKISPDGQYVVWNEYFDSTISRMAIADWDNSACLTLDGGGANPCMEHVDLGSSGDPDHDTDTENMQGLAYAPNGTLWFSTGGPVPHTPGQIEASIGFVDAAFTHATRLDPTAYDNFNSLSDISYKDMVINQSDCTIWVSEGPGPSPANPGVARFESLACPTL